MFDMQAALQEEASRSKYIRLTERNFGPFNYSLADPERSDLVLVE
jgi:hypothetical protein